MREGRKQKEKSTKKDFIKDGNQKFYLLLYTVVVNCKDLPLFKIIRQ